MALYDITYSCGHAGRMNVAGPVKLRAGKVAWYEACLCPECTAAEREKQRQAEIDGLKQQAVENELPALVGSEKQVAWALKIREKFIQDAEHIEQLRKDEPSVVMMLFDVVTKHALEQADAHWWIENRDNTTANLHPAPAALKALQNGLKLYFEVEKLDNAIEEVKRMSPDEFYSLVERISRGEHVQRGITPVTSDEIVVAAELEAERTIRPQVAGKGMTAKITKVIKEDGSGYVAVQTPEYIEGMRSIFRSSGFVWTSPKWILQFSSARQDINDRIIEMAVHILSLGYPVLVPEKWMVARVLNSDYQPMQTRWIKATVGGEFAISWDRGKDGNFYDSAKKISRAHWNKEYGSMRVASEMFLEVLDFAERFDFKLSDKAKELVDRARIIRDNALIGTPEPVKESKPSPLAQRPTKMGTPEKVDIDESLRDDD